MKVLLTGHKGFIGSHMLKALDGHDVRTYEWGEDADKLDTYDRDVCIHIGAISSTTERDVDKIMRQNYDFSCRLLDSCMNTGTHFQYSSSASVYGLGTEFREDSPVDPLTPYAWSKYMFERYALKIQEFADHAGYRVQGFRYFNVYGPDGEEHKGNQASPFAQFKQRAETQGQIKLFEGSENYHRDFVHVSKVVDTHLKFLNIEESGIWNVGTGTTISFKEVAKTFNAKMIDIPMPDVLKSSYQSYTCADITKISATLTTRNKHE